ncbi:MAG: hypothetical protein DRI69_11050 [Bacteroidetes bacterium]|nr:MAG: hypothetical protein DRI69_11050 [Bacteroidota bacterium]
MNAFRLLKRTRTLTLALAMVLVTIPAFSTDSKNKPDSPDELLREKITQLVRNPDLKLIPIHEREVTVEFFVTRENKIVVLDVGTFNKVLEKYIKQKLNYKKIAVKGVRKMMPYKIELAFVVRR